MLLNVVVVVLLYDFVVVVFRQDSYPPIVLMAVYHRGLGFDMDRSRHVATQYFTHLIWPRNHNAVINGKDELVLRLDEALLNPYWSLAFD